MATPGALSHIPDLQEQIIAGIRSGKSLNTIAAEHDVTDAAILYHVRNHPQYQIAVALGAELRMGKREAELESADDKLSIMRTERLLAHARWLAERTCPEQFGAKAQVEHSFVGPIINISVGSTQQLGVDLGVSDATPALEHDANQEVKP